MFVGGKEDEQVVHLWDLYKFFLSSELEDEENQLMGDLRFCRHQNQDSEIDLKIDLSA